MKNYQFDFWLGGYSFSRDFYGYLAQIQFAGWGFELFILSYQLRRLLGICYFKIDNASQFEIYLFFLTVFAINQRSVILFDKFVWSRK